MRSEDAPHPRWVEATRQLIRVSMLWRCDSAVWCKAPCNETGRLAGQMAADDGVGMESLTYTVPVARVRGSLGPWVPEGVRLCSELSPEGRDLLHAESEEVSTVLRAMHGVPALTMSTAQTLESSLASVTNGSCQTSAKAVLT